jgi:hypothetical protein
MIFISFTSPIKRVSGRPAYLKSTKRFCSMITSLEVRDLVVEGHRACARTRYELQPPGVLPSRATSPRCLEYETARSVRSTSTLTARPFPNERHRWACRATTLSRVG